MIPNHLVILNIVPGSATTGEITNGAAVQERKVYSETLSTLLLMNTYITHNEKYEIE